LITSDMGEIMAYMRSRWPSYPYREDMRGIAQKNNNKIELVVLFESANSYDVKVHIEGEDGVIISRELLRAIGVYCFVQLGLFRLTGIADASNEKALALNKKIGFEIETSLKNAADDGGDVIYMVLWRDTALPKLKRLLRGQK
jgi:hypothetical protein